MHSLIQQVAMKLFAFFFCFYALSALTNVFGQQIRESNLALGLSKTSSPVQQQYRSEDPPPTYLTFNVTKSWYNNDHRVSLRKEAGLNLQYSYINLETGGSGASNHYTGNIISLFANAALLTRFRINNTLAFGIGPEVEYLLIGNNNLNNSYYTKFTNPPSSGDIRKSGINRDYFNQPAYGIKISLFESAITEKTNIGLSISYLWTKSEFSDFYAAHYARITFFIGFRKGVDEKPLEE